ncbi:MAG: 50S ribosomal protein L4 [Patescibacteria group bacterium]|nr:50S ribosomal protein L4 [Patescibacteria group bacterium]MDE2116780.1 50S ribosomal protein L4 [Patescibacteria group bacterium]
MEAIIYNKEGKSAGTIKLSEKAFGLPWNADLVHQVMHSMMSSARQPIAHTKTRGEVRGGGKKPWRQKGTGRARHGSTRSPIWVGGGIAHGPRNDKNYDRKVNKTMKAKALLTVLSKKYKDGEILFVDSLSIAAPKTAEAKAALSNLAKAKGFERLATKRKNAAFFALAKKDANVEKSFRNIGSVAVDEVRNINMLDLLKHTFVVIENPAESVKLIEAKL